MVHARPDDSSIADSRSSIEAIRPAGKTTFYHAHLESAGLRFINADVLARELNLDAYAAAKVADAMRRELVKRDESFICETVFSDSARDKLGFLKEAVQSGYTVALCYIGLASPEISGERVAMRVSQGGHDVPAGKLKSRFPRTLANLKAAIREESRFSTMAGRCIDRNVFQSGSTVSTVDVSDSS